MAPNLGRHLLDLAREHVLRDAELAEPELGEPIKHLTLERNAVRHDHIERAQAVGGHDEKGAADLEDFADLATGDMLEARQGARSDGHRLDHDEPPEVV